MKWPHYVFDWLSMMPLYYVVHLNWFKLKKLSCGLLKIKIKSKYVAFLWIKSTSPCASSSNSNFRGKFQTTYVNVMAECYIKTFLSDTWWLLAPCKNKVQAMMQSPSLYGRYSLERKSVLSMRICQELMTDNGLSSSM